MRQQQALLKQVAGELLNQGKQTLDPPLPAPAAAVAAAPTAAAFSATARRRSGRSGRG